MIIALEGIDNAGKTEVAKLLLSYFSNNGKEVYVSRELTTCAGELIKENVNSVGLSPIVKAFLFAADRQIRLEQLGNRINSDSIVIFDRYIYSAIVYREAEGLDGDWVKELNKFNPTSDFTFYIDITPEESMRRNNDAKFNIHYSISDLERIRKVYLNYVKLGRLIYINGMRDVRPVVEEIIGIIKRDTF